MNITELKIFAESIRIETLKQFKARGFGHVGGSMSIVETLAVLYGQEMNYRTQEPRWPERDWLIMSKGHAGPALYSALALRGFFPVAQLMTLNQNGTCLPSHCDRNRTVGIDMTTGSLGQGVSTAIGVALGNQMDGRKNYTYLIVGDGECDEGQVWEGALFAAQHKLERLIAFIDYNKKQLDGYTDTVCALGSLDEKFSTFGWNAQRVDGNDVSAVLDAVRKAKATLNGKPNMIVLDTRKGCGCNFAEDILLNHHMNVTPEQIDGAVEECEKKITALRERG